MMNDLAAPESGAPRRQRREAVVAAHSGGTAPPKLQAPPGSTDCHHHVFDSRFLKPDGVPSPISATVQDYVLFKGRLGISRSVVVAPSTYWNDNSCLVDALDRLGSESTRGVAIVLPNVPNPEMDRLQRHGVNGARIYLGKNRIPSVDELMMLGRSCAKRGWHIQICGDRNREVIVPWENVLRALPCPVVIDHFGWAPQPQGISSATGEMLKRLLDAGGTYVKLSGLYLSSKVGYPDYSDLDAMAVALIRHAPEFMLWGSDWPHPQARDRKPDGARLLDKLTIWCPDDATIQRILVDNPGRLYWAT